jgi:hypothetical protein
VNGSIVLIFILSSTFIGVSLVFLKQKKRELNLFDLLSPFKGISISCLERGRIPPRKFRRKKDCAERHGIFRGREDLSLSHNRLRMFWR